jgi:AraC-like DNA-binding protein
MKNAFYSTRLSKSIDVMRDLNHASIENLNVPLWVNCASCCNTDVEHTNKNMVGRLDYYLLYLIEGRFDVTTDDGQASLSGGEILVIPPRTRYQIHCSGSQIYFLCVHFTGYGAKKLLDENDIKIFPERNHLDPSNHLSQRFKTIFEAFAKDDGFRVRELACLLERLMIEAGRAKKKYKNARVGLSKSIRYIHENYTQSIKIEDLAKIEAICLTLFNRKFKAETGTTPSKYIINLRMRMAIELLETSSLSIKEISAMVGYSNFNFFTRIFKSFTGKSPTQYRKEK